MSVAVCDTPAGKFEFYGYVHYDDNTRLGEREGDEPQFDPGVLTLGGSTYLYTGFCPRGDRARSGAMIADEGDGARCGYAHGHRGAAHHCSWL